MLSDHGRVMGLLDILDADHGGYPLVGFSTDLLQFQLYNAAINLRVDFRGEEGVFALEDENVLANARRKFALWEQSSKRMSAETGKKLRSSMQMEISPTHLAVILSQTGEDDLEFSSALRRTERQVFGFPVPPDARQLHPAAITQEWYMASHLLQSFPFFTNLFLYAQVTEEKFKMELAINGGSIEFDLHWSRPRDGATGALSIPANQILAAQKFFVLSPKIVRLHLLPEQGNTLLILMKDQHGESLLAFRPQGMAPLI